MTTYCRFADDNFRSDVEVMTDDDDFIVVKIADVRYDWDATTPVVPEYDGTNAKEVYEQHLKLVAHMRDLPRRKIWKDYAGFKMYFEDPIEVTTFLRELEQLGYHVPQIVFERLEEE